MNGVGEGVGGADRGEAQAKGLLVKELCSDGAVMGARECTAVLYAYRAHKPRESEIGIMLVNVESGEA